MLNKKGISPLIATVLLVGFTIVLAVIVIGFVTRTTQTTTETTECQSLANNGCLAFTSTSKIDTNKVIATGSPIDGLTITNLAPEKANFTVMLFNTAGVKRGLTYNSPSVNGPGGTTQVLEVALTGGVTPPYAYVPGEKITITPIVTKTVGGLTCIAVCSSSTKEVIIS